MNVLKYPKNVSGSILEASAKCEVAMVYFFFISPILCSSSVTVSLMSSRNPENTSVKVLPPERARLCNKNILSPVISWESVKSDHFGDHMVDHVGIK